MKLFGPSSRHARRLIVNMIRSLSFESVLDVGCGSGLLLSVVREKYRAKKWMGTDVSSNAVSIAKKNLPEGDFFVNDITLSSLPVKSDLVLCCDVLEHVEDYKSALKHIHEMTGKYFLLSTVQGQMREFEKNVGHVRNFHRDELIRDLDATGFEVVKTVEWGFPFYSPLYRTFLTIGGMEEKTCGRYGFFKKIAALTLYYIFFLNLYCYGDYLVILAKKK